MSISQQESDLLKECIQLQQQLAQAIKQRDLAVEKLNKITEMTKESAYPNETLVAIRVVSMNTLKRINKLGEVEK